MIKVAFFKAKDSWVDTAIRLWTRSPYSHCEIILPSGLRITSSGLRGGVCLNNEPIKPWQWDVISLPGVAPGQILAFWEETHLDPYDWFGLFFSQLLPLGLESSKGWTCSEWCAAALGAHRPSQYSPGDLFRALQDGTFKVEYSHGE